MKYYISKVLIVVTLIVPFGVSQLFEHEQKCKMFKDPLNCNAYYQHCIDDVIVRKHCPDNMGWNQNKNICEYNELCRSDVMTKEIEDKNEITDAESENEISISPNKSPFRPIIVRPPRPPSGSNGSIQTKRNLQLFYMLVLIQLLSAVKLL